jgi:hypothetical protein
MTMPLAASASAMVARATASASAGAASRPSRKSQNRAHSIRGFGSLCGCAAQKSSITPRSAGPIARHSPVRCIATGASRLAR